MALQSSGQITLAEVRNEFFGNTGTTQFAMSSLYGKGNAPASSGEIQLAADFYGTSASLNSTTINVGSRATKIGGPELGFSIGSANSATGGTSFGSMADRTISGSSVLIDAVYFRHDTGSDVFRIAFSSAFSSWTSLQVNNAATGANILTLNRSQFFNVTGNVRWQHNFGGPNATNPFSGQRAFVLL